MDIPDGFPGDLPGLNTQPDSVENGAGTGDTYNFSGDFRGATINIKSILQADAHWVLNREYMLRRVRMDWLEGVLEPARSFNSLITLGIQRHLNLVESPWDEILQRTAPSAPARTASNHILNIFNEAKGNLLILGEPGAGKTITLLQLASELVKIAEDDPRVPIPIVLNLSSWNEKYDSLENWLVQELRGKYFMPRAVAEAWIGQDALTLLLDGLDEVSEEKRLACIEAINSFRHNHGPARIVVCCRLTEYKNQSRRLQLDEAVLLQPLEPRQIEEILAGHQQGQNISATISQDATLRELANTPLMLNIMLQASQDLASQDWSHLGSKSAHRERLFDVYLKNVFSRRGPSPQDLEKTTLQVLPWLAKNMSAHGLSVFLLEGLDPGWLKTKRQHLFYYLAIRVLIALMLGTSVYIIYYFGLAPTLAPKMMLAISTAALVTSLLSARLNTPLTLFLNMALTTVTCSLALDSIVGGVVAGVVLGIPGGATTVAIKDPRMTDRLHISWKRIVLFLVIVFSIEILLGIAILRTGGLTLLTTISELLLLAAFPVGTAITLTFGWRPSRRVSPTVKPNQGYWQSLRNTVGVTLFTILIFLPLSLPHGIYRNLEQGENLWYAGGLIVSFLFMLSVTGLVALPLGLFFGGAACLQQLIVRGVLTGAEKLPWNLAHILDNAADRIILQKVGGGYLFQHRLLQEYFADPKHRPNE